MQATPASFATTYFVTCAYGARTRTRHQCGAHMPLNRTDVRGSVVDNMAVEVDICVQTYRHDGVVPIALYSRFLCHIRR